MSRIKLNTYCLTDLTEEQKDKALRDYHDSLEDGDWIYPTKEIIENWIEDHQTDFEIDSKSLKSFLAEEYDNMSIKEFKTIWTYNDAEHIYYWAKEKGLILKEKIVDSGF